MKKLLNASLLSVVLLSSTSVLAWDDLRLLDLRKDESVTSEQSAPIADGGAKKLSRLIEVSDVSGILRPVYYEGHVIYPLQDLGKYVTVVEARSRFRTLQEAVNVAFGETKALVALQYVRGCRI